MPDRPNRKTSDETPVLDRTRGENQKRAMDLLATVAVQGTRSREKVNQVVMLSASPHHEVRRACIPACLSIPSRDGIPVLMTLLADPNPTIQGEAVEALGSLDASSAVKPLRALLTHKSPEIALRAAGALGQLGDRSGFGIAKRHLKTNHPHARLAALAVGRIVGHNFRPNSEGIDAARRYCDAKRL